MDVLCKYAPTPSGSSSFGILILELMTGRHATTTCLDVQQQLAQSGSRAVVAWLKQTRMEARDDLVLTVLQLALRCTSKQSATRPAMGVIAAELEAVLVALGGAHRNAGARQVDLEVESQKMSATCLDTEIARLNDML
ncbi:unnamed protein product [Closterium sp. NIES-64]|nr:unnamed protein product [Closterium sp. NIES-64]